jgi:hypothetical protein
MIRIEALLLSVAPLDMRAERQMVLEDMCMT